MLKYIEDKFNATTIWGKIVMGYAGFLVLQYGVPFVIMHLPMMIVWSVVLTGLCKIGFSIGDTFSKYVNSTDDIEDLDTPILWLFRIIATFIFVFASTLVFAVTNFQFSFPG